MVDRDNQSHAHTKTLNTHTYMFTHTQKYHIHIYTHKDTTHTHTCAHMWTHRNNHNNKIKIIKYCFLRYDPPFLLCGMCSHVSIGWWACPVIKSMGDKLVVATLSTRPLPSSRASRSSWHGRHWWSEVLVVNGDVLLSQDRYAKWTWCQPLLFSATRTLESACCYNPDCPDTESSSTAFIGQQSQTYRVGQSRQE